MEDDLKRKIKQLMSNQSHTVMFVLLYTHWIYLLFVMISEDDKIKFLTALDTFTGEEPVMA